MNKQRNKPAKRQISIETILYCIVYTNPSISIVVLTYISIVVLICCRTALRKCGFISMRKQRIKAVNH